MEENRINEIVDLAREIYIHSESFTARNSFDLAKTFYDAKEDFLKEIEQKKAALVTTPEQQENDGGKVPQPDNNTQI